MRSIAAVILFAVFWCSGAFADQWLAPNEHFPVFGNCVYEKVPPGLAYISVGTDRGFMGAAKTNSGALYVADIDPDVIRFAQINRALIAVSVTAADYRHFRLEATADEWKAAAAKLTGYDLMYQPALTLADSWSWWNTEVRSSNAWGNGFGLLATQPSANPNPEKDAFTGFNYLWDESLFQNLKNLVTNHRIWAEHTTDLTRIDQLSEMIADIQDGFHTQIGAIDSSNVQDDWQAGVDAAAVYFAVLAGNAPSNAVFLNTENANAPGYWWSYFGFTADQINHLNYPQIRAILASETQTLGDMTANYNYKCQFNQQDVGPVWHEDPNGSGPSPR